MGGGAGGGGESRGNRAAEQSDYRIRGCYMGNIYPSDGVSRSQVSSLRKSGSRKIQILGARAEIQVRQALIAAVRRLGPMVMASSFKEGMRLSILSRN
jgi:hypothetical protein